MSYYVGPPRFNAIDAVRARLDELSIQRRPSIKALKLCGSAFHPARVG